MSYTLRAAEKAGIDVLVGFTVAEAQETEGEQLNFWIHPFTIPHPVAPHGRTRNT